MSGRKRSSGGGSSRRSGRSSGSSADARDAGRAAKRQKCEGGGKLAKAWEEKRVRLEVYRDTHKGCCNVPRGWKDDPQLGMWVNNQKREFRKYEEDPATSKLSAERFSALQQMGAIASWQERSRTWEESRVRLEAYRDAHKGCCNVPQRWKDDLHEPYRM